MNIVGRPNMPYSVLVETCHTIRCAPLAYMYLTILGTWAQSGQPRSSSDLEKTHLLSVRCDSSSWSMGADNGASQGGTTDDAVTYVGMRRGTYGKTASIAAGEQLR